MGTPHGLCIYERAGRFFYLGQCVDGAMTGYGLMVDQQELSVYLGQVRDNEKWGHGHLVKYQQKPDLK